MQEDLILLKWWNDFVSVSKWYYEKQPFQWALILLLRTKCNFFELFWRRTMFFAFWRTHGIDCAYEPKIAPKPPYLTQSWADLMGWKRWNAFFPFYNYAMGKNLSNAIFYSFRGQNTASLNNFENLLFLNFFDKIQIVKKFGQNSAFSYD